SVYALRLIFCLEISLSTAETRVPGTTCSLHTHWNSPYSQMASPRLRLLFPGSKGDNWLLTRYFGFVDLSFSCLIAEFCSVAAFFAAATNQGERVGKLPRGRF